jgi:hypothetical protein
VRETELEEVFERGKKIWEGLSGYPSMGIVENRGKYYLASFLHAILGEEFH